MRGMHFSREGRWIQSFLIVEFKLPQTSRDRRAILFRIVIMLVLVHNHSFDV